MQLLSRKQKARQTRNAAIIAEYNALMKVPGQCIGEVHEQLMRKFRVKRRTIYRILEQTKKQTV